MAEPFLGEIRLMAFKFPPRGWATCDGQTMAISQNQALYALLGTTYGGNGTTTFRLPDLRGRVAMHQGEGHSMGEMGGAEYVTLSLAHMPGDHNHDFLAVAGEGHVLSPSGAALARVEKPAFLSPSATTQRTMLSPAAVDPGVPASMPHENRQPYLALQYCIAIQGIFPTRN